MPNKISVGGEQQRKDKPPKLIPNEPASSIGEALGNAQKQVDQAKRG
jgi:hypothetical protein